MKMKAYLSLVLVVISLALVLLEVEGQGSRCGDGVVCTGDRCCSRWGWCGMTAAHCGDGCQSICRCGQIAGGVVCTGGRCCSAWGWCGTTAQHCGSGCQSNCRRLGLPPSPLRSIISQQMFTDLLVINRNNASFPSGSGFDYPYPAFIIAANSFPEFANSGDLETNKRELAAFFAQTSNQSPHWFPDDSEDLLTNKREIVAAFFSHINTNQTTDLVAVPDAVLSFKTAIWSWMRPQAHNMPSCHELMTGKWSAEIASNVIHGGRQCGFPGPENRVENRLGFYKKYCELLGVSYGDHLDFYSGFNNGGLLLPGVSSST